MSILWAASLRHLLRHPAQLALALVGLSVGVATIVAVDIATASSRHALQLSMEAVNGAATHEIVAGPGGIDERVYVSLRATEATRGIELAPVVEGYVSVADRTLQLIGFDPLASPQLGAGRDTQGSTTGTTNTPAGVAPREWFNGSGAVVMAANTARELGLARGSRFTLDVDGRPLSALLIGTLGERAGYDSLLLTDIAQAQEWMECVGRLSRIDVRVPEGTAGEIAARRLAQALPPGLRLEPSAGRTRQNLDMTAAFTTNLKAMSLLALLVSTLLIYGAMSFAVVQRRRIIGILRALGATRAEVLRIVLTEAALLGLLGALAGLLLGVVIGRGLVHLVSQTINDLYYVVAVNDTVLPLGSLLKAMLAGLGTALVGALLPALEVAGSVPQLGLRRSVLEARAVRLARRLAFTGAALAVASGVVAFASGRNLTAGFVALLLLLLSAATVTPAALRAAAVAAARWSASGSATARLACSDIAASLSRTGVAVAALGMALAAMIGVSIMVASFRESLRAWLERSLRADIYVTAPGVGTGRPERRIDPKLLNEMLTLPGVADYGLSRRVTLDGPQGPISLDAVQYAHDGHANVPLTTAGPDLWTRFEQGGVIVSEPLAWRLRLQPGSELNLALPEGAHSFTVVGVYREYGNERGNVVLSLPIYRQLWRDDAVTSAGLYLAPGVSAAQTEAQLRRLSQRRQALYIRSNAALRALSMSIFERTFVITRVLYWLAAGVAAIGLVSALLAWELERSRELAVLRSVGLTPRAAALLIETQTVFMGLVALLAAIPCGLLTALLLIEVINRRAFGWRIDLHLSGAQFGNALLLALAAALAAGVYPAWRVARASIASEMREE